MALITSGGATGKAATWPGIVEVLQAKYVTAPELKTAVRLLRELASAHRPASDAFLREVIANNPDRRARGRACQALALGRERAAGLGERLKGNDAFRQSFERQMADRAFIEHLIADAPAAKAEAEELSRTVREKYDDVCPDLSIGKSAPEVFSQDLEGRKVKLSELKGKVVVLDLWATWCVPCRAMIPHEREMLGRLADKPFALVSISVDDDKETVTNFLKKEQMPWVHWWNGREGGIVEDWNVEAYPTIYIIDSKGIIRFKNLRDKELEEAVNQLLGEIEPPK
jgi:thiol-disulfide isomerase/thioredoxin